MGSLFLAVVALATLMLLPAPARAVGVSVGGFGEIRFSAQPGVDGVWWNLAERVRPRFQGQLHERIAVVAEVEMLFVQGRNATLEIQNILEGSDFGPLLDLAEVEWPTKANEILQIDDITDVLSVERLYVDFYLPFMDLRIGRQALFWGSAMMINPTDPFPEFLLAEPWRQRAGTNAVRATIPIKDRADFTFVLASNDIFTKVRAAGRLRLRLPFADLALVAAFRQDDLDALIGMDLRGELGVGWWFEGSLHVRETIYEEFAVGIDYSFPLLDGFIVMAQYYRNGAGAGPKDTPDTTTVSIPIELPAELADAFASETPDAAKDPRVFAPLLGGRDYFLLSLNLAIVREISVSAMALQNLNDGTGFAIPTVTVSPTGWLQLALSAQIPYRLWGDGGEFKPDPDSLVLSQEIGPFNQLYEADLSGLLPDATVTFWTRANF